MFYSFYYLIFSLQKIRSSRHLNLVNYLIAKFTWKTCVMSCALFKQVRKVAEIKVRSNLYLGEGRGGEGRGGEGSYNTAHLPAPSHTFPVNPVIFHDFDLFVLELSELFPLNEVAKALLRLPNGPWFICRLLVNFPDYFEQGKCFRLQTGDSAHICDIKSSCSYTGSIRDDPYWTSRKNSLELIELSSINKVSLV